jgi:hypothetical protein
VPASTEHDRAPLHFVVHGVPFLIVCDAAPVRDALRSRLGAFADEFAASGDVVTVTITGPNAPPILSEDIGDSGRVVYDTAHGAVRYFDASARSVADFAGRAQLTLDARGGRLDIAVIGSTHADQMLAAYPMFTLALTEILKARGLYAVHAACPAAGKRALLLAGTSGSGKSTLAFAFARRGHPLLSDDTVFVDEPGTTVFAFPDEIDVTDTTATMFAELRSLAAQAKRPGREKHAVAIDSFSARPPDQCTPAAIVLIRPNRSAVSRLTPVAGARALHELAANVLLTDAATSQRHLDALGALARGLPAYALSTGRDLDHAVDLLEPLFADGTQPRSISNAAPT